MMKTKLIAVGAFALSLCSCVNSGTMVSDDQMKNIKIGVSTERDVVAALGTPTNISRHSNGKRSISYMGIKGGMSATSYIPIVGAFAGRTESKTCITTFEIAKNGKVLSIEKEDSDMK